MGNRKLKLFENLELSSEPSDMDKVAIAQELINPFVKGRVLPKITKLLNAGFNRGQAFHHDYFQNTFEDYFLRRYVDLITIDTLVLQNQQVPFHSLYHPLTVQTHVQKELIEIRVDHYPEELLPQFYRVLIQDAAGMGKSTLLRKLFLSAIEENQGIPILIPLRRLRSDHSVLQEILEQVSPLGEDFDEHFLLHLIKRGDFIFLFDGFDEIALDQKDAVIQELHSFIDKAGNNLFVMSSRPEEGLASFGDFRNFSIRPLQKQEAYALIETYALCDQRALGKDLISLLKQEDYKGVHEFLSNPLLVALLYAAFDYGREIPLEKAQFYSLVYDALFNRHDLSKPGYFKRKKSSGLHKDNFEKVLRGLGYRTLKMGKVEYQRHEILATIKTARDFYQLEFEASDFLDDLLRAVPLFQKEGQYLKWSHKSLQDYFAARFICLDAGEKAGLILAKLAQGSHFPGNAQNVLEICYYLDSKLFRGSVTKLVIDSIIEFIEDHIDRFPNSDRQQVIRYLEGYTSYYLGSNNPYQYYYEVEVLFIYPQKRPPNFLTDTTYPNTMLFHTIGYSAITYSRSLVMGGIVFEFAWVMEERGVYYGSAALEMKSPPTQAIISFLTKVEPNIFSKAHKELPSNLSAQLIAELSELFSEGRDCIIHFPQTFAKPNTLLSSYIQDLADLQRCFGSYVVDYQACLDWRQKLKKAEEASSEDFF